MDARWGAGWSRPKAIFARHGVAVREGAPKITPQPTLGDWLERTMWQVPVPYNVDGSDRRGPKCSDHDAPSKV